MMWEVLDAVPHEKAPVDPLSWHATKHRQPPADVVSVWVKFLGLLAVHQHVVKGVRICRHTGALCHFMPPIAEALAA